MKMREREAIETIKYATAFNSDNSPLTRALDMATEALEKQVPKKPTEMEEQNFRYITKYECPNCHKGFTGSFANYCYHCGQKLLWE